MRTYEEIRQSLRRQAIAKLVALGLLAVVAASALVYGLVQGGRRLWAALTGPRTVIVKLAPASAPVRPAEGHHCDCPHTTHVALPEPQWHLHVPHVHVHTPRRVHRHRHAYVPWGYDHWSW